MFDDEQIVGDIVQSISGLGLGDLNEQAFLISKPLYFETTNCHLAFRYTHAYSYTSVYVYVCVYVYVYAYVYVCM